MSLCFALNKLYPSTLSHVSDTPSPFFLAPIWFALWWRQMRKQLFINLLNCCLQCFFHCWCLLIHNLFANVLTPSRLFASLPRLDVWWSTTDLVSQLIKLFIRFTTLWRSNLLQPPLAQFTFMPSIGCLTFRCSSSLGLGFGFPILVLLLAYCWSCKPRKPCGPTTFMCAYVFVCVNWLLLLLCIPRWR